MRWEERVERECRAVSRAVRREEGGRVGRVSRRDSRAGGAG